MHLSQPQNVFDQAPSCTHVLVVGSKVNHERFGHGVVKAIEGLGPERKAEIEFDSGGVKKLLLRFAKLTLLS